MFINVTGRVGIVPEKKTAKNGRNFYAFSVCVNEWRNGSNVPIWLLCTLFTNETNRVVESLSKGSVITLCGDLVVDIVPDNQTGQMRALYKVNTFHVQYTGINRPRDENGQPRQAQPYSQVQQQSQPSYASAASVPNLPPINNDNFEDDLPF